MSDRYFGKPPDLIDAILVIQNETRRLSSPTNRGVDQVITGDYYRESPNTNPVERTKISYGYPSGRIGAGSINSSSSSATNLNVPQLSLGWPGNDEVYLEGNEQYLIQVGLVFSADTANAEMEVNIAKGSTTGTIVGSSKFAAYRTAITYRRSFNFTYSIGITSAYTSFYYLINRSSATGSVTLTDGYLLCQHLPGWGTKVRDSTYNPGYS